MKVRWLDWWRRTDAVKAPRMARQMVLSSAQLVDKDGVNDGSDEGSADLDGTKLGSEDGSEDGASDLNVVWASGVELSEPVA